MSKLLLEALSGRFRLYASDQIACKRWQSTKRDKATCDLKAEIWNDAANEIETVLREYNEDGTHKEIETARKII